MGGWGLRHEELVPSASRRAQRFIVVGTHGQWGSDRLEFEAHPPLTGHESLSTCPGCPVREREGCRSARVRRRPHKQGRDMLTHSRPPARVTSPLQASANAHTWQEGSEDTEQGHEDAETRF